jgi:hypothetical protein
MKILQDMMGRIFGRKKAKDAKAAAPTAQAAPAPTATPTVAPLPPGPTPLSDVDVLEVLDDLAAEAGQKLNWKTSIVDLMKLLDMDASLANRKDLADELGYPGDKSDSAAMNIWLHKEVIKAFAANGGKVPQDMLD